MHTEQIELDTLLKHNNTKLDPINSSGLNELEPPPEYPGAHLNQIHSYPPHDGMPVLLEHIGIKYTIIQPVPNTCHLPKIIDPDKPLKWWEILIIGLAAVGIGYLIVKTLKQ